MSTVYAQPVACRGYSTPASGTLAAGLFAGGTNGTLGGMQPRGDLDVQLLWQLDNLGFGNVARVHLRGAQHQEAELEFLRMQDRVAAEVTQAYSEARQSARRVQIHEREVKLAIESYEKNLVGLGQTRRAGELVQTVIRPQEALASVQALTQSYTNYYASVADSNRAQFRLYRALGHPAQCIAVKPDGPGPEGAPQPAVPPAPVPASPASLVR